MRLIKEKTSIDFLGPTRRKIALALSVFFVVVSFASLATRGLEFGIDFTGGILLEVGYQEAANLEGIRSDLASEGYANAQVQRFGSDNVVLVRLPPQEGDVDQIRSRLQETLQARDTNTVLRHRTATHLQIIVTRLIPKSTRAGVNHDRNLSRLQIKRFCRVRAVHLIHHLHF